MKTRRILAFLFIATFMLSFSAAAMAQGELDDGKDTVYTFKFQLPTSSISNFPMQFNAESGKMVTLGWTLEDEFTITNAQLTVTVYHNGLDGEQIFSATLRQGQTATFPIYEKGTYRIEVKYSADQSEKVQIDGILRVVVPYLSSF